MKVLVINCGSSSLKFQLIDSETESVLAKGICERIGGNGVIVYQPQGKDKEKTEVEMKDHTTAVKLVLEALVNPKTGVVKDLSEIEAVGHRILHGGEKFAGSFILNDEILKAVESCNDLGPLHNPANLIGVNSCQKLMPGVPMIGVFDTAFHQTMPQKAFMYALPYKYYTDYQVRRYGFHGTSHDFVSTEAAKVIGKTRDDLKIIVCHLGNGASISAVDHGKCVDTSMGLTPLEGLIMGTRSGDLDPAILSYVMKKEKLNIQEMTDVLNKESGVLGLSGVGSDFRDLGAAAAEGNERAQMTLETYAYRVGKYIGSYVAAMGGVDIIAFTAGVGENDSDVRARIGQYFKFLDTTIDPEKNKVRGESAIISTEDSKVTVMVVPTNEELAICRETVRLLKN